MRTTHAEVDGREGWDGNNNTISLAPLDEHTVIDVPSPYDTLSHYRATLGHKANHHPDNNAEYDFALHPRFGLIKAVVAVRGIDCGQEILVDYGYTDDRPDWFTEELWGPVTRAFMQRQEGGQPSP